MKSKTKIAKKSYKKKMYKRKFKKSHRKMSQLVCKDKGGYPDVYNARFDLADTSSYGSGSTSFKAINYFINNLPNGQPGVNSLCIQYNEYLVEAASIKLRIFNRNSIPIKVIIVPINIENQSFAPATAPTYYLAKEMKNSKEVILSEAGTSKDCVTIKDHIAVKTLAGDKPVANNQVSSTLSGYTGGGAYYNSSGGLLSNSTVARTVPIDVFAWYIQFQAYDDVSILDLNSVTVEFEQSQWIRFYDRIPSPIF